MVVIGTVEGLYRVPVKSMGSESLADATLGWHGLDGDRRLAFRRLDDTSEFPWLTASKLPEMVRFTPVRDAAGALTHMRTPEGDAHAVLSAALDAEVSRRYGAPVQLMRMKHGIFDEGLISVIAASTIDEISRLANRPSDVRRFRPNIFVRTTRAVPFEEDDWVGATLSFGDGDDAPMVAVTLRDERCAMINFDPDGGNHPELMKTVVRIHDNTAGVYATVTRTGRLAVGQRVYLRRDDVRRDD